MDGNQVTTMNTGTAVAATGADPYASYGAKVGTQGLFLSFKNNEYLYGQNGDSLPLGTKVAANMAGLRVGWRRWYGEQVTDDLTEMLVDQRPLAPRNTLGDNDVELWEREKTKDGTPGKPRDPWQVTNILELVDGEGQQFIYSTGSKGGIGAIGRLCKEYGKLYRQRPGMVPIITLGSDFYMHKEFGKTYFPVLTIVGWTDENALTIEEGAEDAAPEPQQGSQRAANPTQGGIAPPTAIGAKTPNASTDASTTMMTSRSDGPEPAPAPAPAASAKKARF